MFPTDKIAHGYLPAYLQIAEVIGPSAAVCEIGVANGGSLQLWQSLFPHGVIVGVDNHPAATWPQSTHKILAPQNDPRLPEQLAAITSTYDLIVDDASHDGRLTAETHRLLWPLVRSGGFYVIEDWQISIWRQPNKDDGSMLETVSKLLLWLNSPDSEVRSITYQYGMAILRKR